MEMGADPGPLSAISALWQDVDKHPSESSRDRDRRVLTAWMLFNFSESLSHLHCALTNPLLQQTKPVLGLLRRRNFHGKVGSTSESSFNCGSGTGPVQSCHQARNSSITILMLMKSKRCLAILSRRCVRAAILRSRMCHVLNVGLLVCNDCKSSDP